MLYIKSASLSRLKALVYPLLLICLINPAFAESEDETAVQVKTFYKNPSYTTFLNIAQYMSKHIEDKHRNLYSSVFIISVLTKHNDYASLLVDDFGKFNANEKKLLYLSLLGTELTDQALKIKNKYHYKNDSKPVITIKTIENLKFPDKLTSSVDLVQQSTIVPYLWAAFYGSGDIKYIRKMVQYICAHINYIKLNASDLTATGRVPTEQQKQIQKSLGVLSWSLNVRRCEDPSINTIVTNLAKEYDIEGLFVDLKNIFAKPCN